MTSRLGLSNGQHTAGLYADMTVDGPEIGTLVVVLDRAKNLPNRRTMGKQDPYCAARLGKEAKKTNTDMRGGQTPRWDQELRFTVHESPDYHNLKVSVFNDDKRTDLIGETWVALMDRVIVPGGGRHDGWHHLNYKGKYAGEVRIEMSYYDSRAPERPESTDTMKKKSPVKRRPLPAGPSQVVTPQFGPRKLGCARGETVFLDPDGNPTAPPEPEHGIPEEHFNPYQPDFLPQIPPTSRHRGSLPQAHSQMMLAHSQSAPDVHSVYAESQYHDEASEYGYEPGPVDFAVATNGLLDMNSHWDHQSVAPFHQDTQSWQGSQFDAAELPPLPPSHSNTPQHDRHHSYDQQSHVSPISPLHSLERSYGSSPQSRPMSEYGTPVRNSAGPSPLRREVPSQNQLTHAHPNSSPVSPFSRSVGSSSGMPPYPIHDHPGITRHSVSDPYAAVTPPKPAHPLSQEMRRSTSPQPYHGQPGFPEPSNYHFPEDNVQLVKPRPQSSPRARHSIAAIRHPVSTFAAQNSPATAPHAHPRGTPVTRKSVSPAATPGSASSSSVIPFGPDAFDHFNPSAQVSQLDAQPNPHNPYHIPAAPAKSAASKDTTIRNADGKIVGFDGREIDPSDHLPVDSWAPEPEVKTPIKQYGTRGEGRGFGPRTTNITSGSSTGNIKVNVRTRRMGSGDGSPIVPSPGSIAGSAFGGSNASSPVSPTKDGRNRLVKKNGPFARSPAMGGGPLSEIAVPNPYGGGSPTWGSPGSQAPPKPPKIPMATVEDEVDRFGYGSSALSREMAKIDIGGIGGRRPRPAEGRAVGMVRYGA
ncbi:C2 domain-containing protein 3 [Elsinoe fawcettii]|nr:C2 domain-containing protein 3 [Elsinoe fawcettii]